MDFFIPHIAASSDVSQVRAAIAEWERHTCIRFRPRNGDRAFLYFKNGRGCSSYVGFRNVGYQPIGLSQGCRVVSLV